MIKISAVNRPISIINSFLLILNLRRTTVEFLSSNKPLINSKEPKLERHYSNINLKLCIFSKKFRSYFSFPNFVAQMDKSPKIYFHVGLGKVASTYMQQRLFPKLDGIHYISTHSYRKSPNQIDQKNFEKYLVSREFDRQYERELRWWAGMYPDSHIIIVFRKHGSWIASQYRRAVKNGRILDFDEFFNLDESKSFWKHAHINFYSKLQLIEELFTKKPLVLFHEELKADAWVFFDKISSYAHVSYRKENVSLKVTHKSYTEKQLRVLRAFCRRFKRKAPKGHNNKLKHWLLYRPWWAFYHLIMYVAAWFPHGWVPRDPLIPDGRLEAIDDAFVDDWQKVKAYAKQNNPAY